MNQVPPIHPTGRHYILHIQSGGLFFVAVVLSDISPLLVFSILERLRDLVNAYLGAVNSTVVKDQFMTIYHVFDEVLDGGLPYNLEANALLELVRAPTLINRTRNILGTASLVAQTMPEGMLTGTPWRRANVLYPTNEMYLDMIEEVDGAIDGVTGQLLNPAIRGHIAVECSLSGVPDLTLKLTQMHLLDDVSLHACVRAKRFENEKIVSFVPPDGKFTLMEYRVGGDLRLPFTIKPHVTLGDGTGTLTLTVTSKGDKPIEDLNVTIPFDKMCNGITMAGKGHAVNIDEISKTCTWFVKQLPPQQSASLEGNFHFDTQLDVKPTKPLITLKFKVSGWSASGIKVDTLTLINEKYNHFKGLKTITMGGEVEVRL